MLGGSKEVGETGLSDRTFPRWFVVAEVFGVAVWLCMCRFSPLRK